MTSFLNRPSPVDWFGYLSDRLERRVRPTDQAFGWMSVDNADEFGLLVAPIGTPEDRYDHGRGDYSDTSRSRHRHPDSGHQNSLFRLRRFEKAGPVRFRDPHGLPAVLLPSGWCGVSGLGQLKRSGVDSRLSLRDYRNHLVTWSWVRWPFGTINETTQPSTISSPVNANALAICRMFKLR